LNTPVASNAWLFALFGITVSVVLALAGALWIHWRDNAKAHAELAVVVAGVSKAAEIYDRSQQAFLSTIQSITAQHADMYRDLSTRFAMLEERTTNHGEELRRIARNVHDLRTEARESITSNTEALRAEITHLSEVHRQDMARIQLRRRGDT
jgi:hypothetical protein